MLTMLNNSTVESYEDKSLSQDHQALDSLIQQKTWQDDYAFSLGRLVRHSEYPDT
jgi:hypothetical protein